MDETFPTKAIILKRQDFRERDSKVTLYSIDKGRLELVARGTKKITSKLAGHIEPIARSQIMVIKGKQWDYIGSAVSEESYPVVKSDLSKLEAAGEAMRVVLKAVKPGEADREIFRLVLDFLKVLDRPATPPEMSRLLLHFFILKFLVRLGLSPELYRYSDSRKPIEPGKNIFDLEKGGIIKSNASSSKDQLAISESCIKILRLSIKEDFDKLCRIKFTPVIFKETVVIIRAFYEYQTG